MGIGFEAITFDSNLQWDLEWQLCICLETNAKQNAATQLQLSLSPIYNYQRWKFHLENSGTETHLWIPRLSLIAQ